MKENYKSWNKLAVAYFLGATLALGFTACSTDDSSSSTDTETTAKIQFNVAGITEGDDSTLTKAQATPQVFVDTLENGYELVCSLTPDRKSLTRATSTMATGRTFRVIAYKNDNGTLTYASYVDGTAGGSSPVLTLDAGQKYTIVAYSYNQSTAISDVVNDSTTTISPLAGADLLYYTTEITPVYGTNTALSITFAHKLAKVRTQIISANGYTITAVSASLGTLKSAGTMNLQTGAVTEGADLSQSNFSIGGSATTYGTNYTNFMASDSNYVFAKNYTSAFTLTITSLTSSGVSLSSKTSSFAASNMLAGYRYVLDVRLRKAYALTWASGNLYKTGTATSTIQIASSQSTFVSGMAGGYYWNWGILNTTNPSTNSTDYQATYANWGTVSGRSDPCTLWNSAYRLPTYSEMTAVSAQGRYWGTMNSVNGIYLGTILAPVTGTENNYIFLPAIGFRQGGGGTIMDNTGGSSGSSEYWTNAYYSGNTWAYNLQFNAASCTLGVRVRDAGVGIRCVK
ncbi:MAG: hypothetical protein H6Q14_971 [Bacteroidetes bacterium]|nr:hypothetical protein [Bacteroidota bacterium]